MSDYVRGELCRAIDSLLGEGTIQERVSSANRYLIPLKFYESEIPEGILKEFSEIINYLNDGETEKINKTASEKQENLVDRLLIMYIIINGGNLIL